MKEKFTKYERARILGARALQIAMNAPVLIKISKEESENIKYDPLKIAEIELDAGVLPITVKRPFPEKKEAELKRIKTKVTNEELEKREAMEEGEIVKEGEIMELATPEDEETSEEIKEE